MHTEETDSPISTPPSSTDAKVESGLRWAAMRQIVTGLVGSVGAIAYARFLQPEDLGAFTLAFLVYSGLFLLVQAPIRDAVVYYKDDEDVYGSAAFWLLSGFSTAAITLVLILAEPMGNLYQSPLAAGLTRGMTVAFFFQATAVVPAALLLKRFRFAAHESLQTISQLILLAGWVSLAAAGYGPWSLVIPFLISSIFWASTAWFMAGFRPTLRPGRAAYSDIIRFSRSLFGSKLIIYLNRNIDNAAVGSLGQSALGWYSFGEEQASFAAVSVSTSVAQIALPAMAAVHNQMEEFRRIYLDMLRLTATLTMPMQIGALVLADLGISLIFGEQWLGGLPVFRAYVTLWLLNTLLEVSDAATSAIGRPDVRFRVDLLQLPFFVAGTWFGLRVWGGIAGVAWSLVIVRIGVGLIYFAATMRVIQLPVSKVLRYLLPSSLAAGLMGIIIYQLRGADFMQKMAASINEPFLADLMTLGVLVLVGVVIYFTVLFAVDRRGFTAVLALAWRILLPEPIRNRLISLRNPNAQIMVDKE